MSPWEINSSSAEESASAAASIGARDFLFSPKFLPTCVMDSWHTCDSTWTRLTTLSNNKANEVICRYCRCIRRKKNAIVKRKPRWKSPPPPVRDLSPLGNLLAERRKCQMARYGSDAESHFHRGPARDRRCARGCTARRVPRPGAIHHAGERNLKINMRSRCEALGAMICCYNVANCRLSLDAPRFSTARCVLKMRIALNAPNSRRPFA
jgi:hypothetical protein